jgi:hypothetical protein
MRHWLLAFAFTQLIEIPIYNYALREFNFSRLKRFAVAFGASAITHPVVWFAFPRWMPNTPVVMLIASELFAIVVEAAYLRAFRLSRSLGWSLVANSLSFGISIFSRKFFGYP